MPSEETPKNQIEKPEIKKTAKEMENFYKEIVGYINDYNNGKITGTMYDLSLIDDKNNKDIKKKINIEERIKDLTPEDADMWEKVNNFKTNPIPLEDLDTYQEHVKASKNSSRDNFRAFIVQKITWLSSLNMDTREQPKK